TKRRQPAAVKMSWRSTRSDANSPIASAQTKASELSSIDARLLWLTAVIIGKLSFWKGRVGLRPALQLSRRRSAIQQCRDALRSRRSDLRVLFLADLVYERLTRAIAAQRGLHFLVRPFTVAELSAKVRQALDSPVDRPIQAKA